MGQPNLGCRGLVNVRDVAETRMAAGRYMRGSKAFSRTHRLAPADHRQAKSRFFPKTVLLQSRLPINSDQMGLTASLVPIGQFTQGGSMSPFVGADPNAELEADWPGHQTSDGHNSNSSQPRKADSEE